METKKDWEVEFDRKFDLDDYGSSTAVQDLVKKWIRTKYNEWRLAVEIEFVKSTRSKMIEEFREIVHEHMPLNPTNSRTYIAGYSQARLDMLKIIDNIPNL